MCPFVAVVRGISRARHGLRKLNAMDQVIGVMLVIVAIGLLADKIFFSPIERLICRSATAR